MIPVYRLGSSSTSSRACSLTVGNTNATTAIRKAVRTMKAMKAPTSLWIRSLSRDLTRGSRRKTRPAANAMGNQMTRIESATCSAT